MARRQDDLYGLIKRLSCIDKPIPSQVILTKTLNDPRRLNSVISKIALQINCKLGGGLWTIRMPRVSTEYFGSNLYCMFEILKLGQAKPSETVFFVSVG